VFGPVFLYLHSMLDFPFFCHDIVSSRRTFLRPFQASYFRDFVFIMHVKKLILITKYCNSVFCEGMINTYKPLDYNHRVDKLLGFLYSRPNWDPPPPYQQASMPPPL
jgi:hypothetical protein